jgi:hypothetical protein
MTRQLGFCAMLLAAFCVGTLMLLSIGERDYRVPRTHRRARVSTA